MNLRSNIDAQLAGCSLSLGVSGRIKTGCPKFSADPDDWSNIPNRYYALPYVQDTYECNGKYDISTPTSVLIALSHHIRFRI